MNNIFIFIKKDFWEDSSYRTSFFLKIFKILFTITIFYYFSKFVKQDLIKDYTLFQYIFTGHIFYEFLIKYLKAPSSIIITEQYKGTLELLFNSKIKPYKIVIYSMLYGFIIDIFLLTIYLSSGIIFFNISVNLSFVTFLQFILIFVISLIYLTSLGFIGVAITLIIKKSDPFTSALRYFFLLAGGIYFPIDILPKWVLFIGKLFPLTDAINLTRNIFYNGNFNLNSFLYILIHTIILFNIALKRVKKDNLLSIY